MLRGLGWKEPVACGVLARGSTRLLLTDRGPPLLPDWVALRILPPTQSSQSLIAVAALGFPNFTDAIVAPM